MPNQNIAVAPLSLEDLREVTEVDSFRHNGEVHLLANGREIIPPPIAGPADILGGVALIVPLLEAITGDRFVFDESGLGYYRWRRQAP